MRAAAADTSFGRLGAVTFSSGIVEWRPDETREVFDARARMAVGRTPAHPPDLRGANDEDSLGAPGVR